jgi:hypothetical protein
VVHRAGVGDVEVGAGERHDVVPGAPRDLLHVATEHPRGPGDQNAHRR